MVVDSPEVEAVLFGPDGAAEGLGEGGLAIDMSTIAPSASRAIGDRLRERGIAFLDAPVTGSKPKAEDGTLTIMVGGERRGLRAGAARCSRRWESSCSTSARRDTARW